MKLKLLVPILTLCLVLACGCASPAPQASTFTAATIAKNSTTDRDDFKKVTSVTSPFVSYKGDAADVTAVIWSHYYLYAEKSDGATEPHYWITISTQRGYGLSWAFWKELVDHEGKSFPLQSESTNADGGLLRETSSTQVTRAYLESITASGMDFQVYGQCPTEAFPIYGSWVSGFLQRCDTQFSK